MQFLPCKAGVKGNLAVGVDKGKEGPESWPTFSSTTKRGRARLLISREYTYIYDISINIFNINTFFPT